MARPSRALGSVISHVTVMSWEIAIIRPAMKMLNLARVFRPIHHGRSRAARGHRVRASRGHRPQIRELPGPPPSTEAPQAPVEISLVHELPHRVRVRLSTQLADVPPSLVAALRRSSLVVSFRISWSCRSVAVEHVASTAAIVRLLRTALCHGPASPADEPAVSEPAREADHHRRHAERQLSWCSAIGLALVFVPAPTKPALVVARMAVGIALDLVQKRAEQFAPRPPVARCLDLLAWGASILRAEHRLYEFIASLLRKQLEDALRPRVQLGFGAAAAA